MSIDWGLSMVCYLSHGCPKPRRRQDDIGIQGHEAIA